MASVTQNRIIGCLVGAGVVVLVGCLLFLVLIGSAIRAASKSVDAIGPGPKIAHLDLEGIISSSQMGSGLFGAGDSMVDKLREALKALREDDEVKAIVLRINSPGGEVTASDVIYNAVRQTAEEKPVVVYMDSMAASGGFYVACAADEIIANETTLTGSIGVIIQTLNYEDLFGKVGLDTVVFKSGKFKDALGGAREMSSEEKEYMQEVVMQIYEKFLGIVSESRGIPEGKLRQNIADGRIITGKDAAELKLVDATGYIEDAYDRARELTEEPDAKVMKYEGEKSAFEVIFGSVKTAAHRAASGEAQRVEIDVSDRLLPRLQPGMVYLLPGYYAP